MNFFFSGVVVHENLVEFVGKVNLEYQYDADE